MLESIRKSLVVILSVTLCFLTLILVNYNVLQSQSSLALFVMLGLVLCFLTQGIKETNGTDEDPKASSVWTKIDRSVRVLLSLLTIICCGYIFVQTEPYFKHFWPDSDPFTRPTSLGNRAGAETRFDFIVAITGLLLVLEATRRCIGWVVPALSLLFVLHAYFAPQLPDWLLPHQGSTVKEIACNTFLQSLGVLGPAASVMFRYVFLFVVFGAFLEMSGATKFIVDFSQRVFGRGAGGPAKVAVLGSGLMGSLSGSAVANAVTTGSFTIPMMRNAGFQPSVAGGITAAAATGAALVPPVMGAGAYMMLEFVQRPPGQPQVIFLEIAKAALIPAMLYYFSLWMIVHYYAKKIGTDAVPTTSRNPVSIFEGIVFFGALGLLILLLVMGMSPFKAVTGALVIILTLSIFRPKLPLGIAPRILAFLVLTGIIWGHQISGHWTSSTDFQTSWLKPFLALDWQNADDQATVRQVFDSLLNSSFLGMLGLLVFGLTNRSWRPEILTAMTGAAKNGIALIAASACVGIIIGIVQSTPIANEFGEAIKSVVETNLFLALVGIMACSIVLGMGVPSVVCYLLMATLMGSLLGELGVDPLAAHLFIFYYGMMSMVTPPVALAAYASASIAKAPIMRTAWESFRFSLVGFALPFLFIYRPALLLMGVDGQPVHWANVVIGGITSMLGVVALAAGQIGYLRNHLKLLPRILAFVAAAMLLAPKIGGPQIGFGINLAGAVLLAVLAASNRPSNPRA